MHRRQLLVLGGLLAATALGLAAWWKLSRPAPIVVRSHIDVVYATVDGQALRLDLYVPANQDPAPPLLVWIHGGGWKGGDKSDSCPIRWLARRGYAVANINYRLSGQATFPAQVHDCKAAIRWLRASGDAYGYDGRWLGVAGGSAGGHLAAMLATTAGVDELEGTIGDHANMSSRVQAAVIYFASSDLTYYTPEADPKGAELVGQLLGGPVSDKPELARLASPVSHVTADDAPLLILHGDADQTVRPQQSRLLYERYRAAGADATLYMVQGGGHGGPQFHDADRREMVRRFFDQHVRSPMMAGTD